MALVRVFVPESEPELLAVVALLEAHEVPCFVQNEGFGSLLPGPQIGSYNARSIMVPEERVAAARELLQDFAAQTPDPVADPAPASGSALRMLFEFLLFGWFIPGRRRENRRD